MRKGDDRRGPAILRSFRGGDVATVFREVERKYNAAGALDAVTTMIGGLMDEPAAVSSEEIEVELVTGDRELLTAVGARLRAACRHRDQAGARARGPVRAENLIRGCEQQSCHASDPAVMITVHVPAVRAPPDHATSGVAAAVRREETWKTAEILILRHQLASCSAISRAART